MNESGVTDQPEELHVPALPPLWKRAVDVFVAPGELFSALAREPRWFAAAALGAVILGIGGWLVPAEVYASATRAVMLERGMPVPDQLERMAAFQRMAATFLGPVMSIIMTAAFAGVAVLIFAFVLGDRGTYKQYLAGAAHAGIITAVGYLVSTPVRIATEDPQFGISLGSLAAGFVSDGYFLNFLRTQQLFGIWATFVFAIAISKIDIKRSPGGAFAILMVLGIGFGLAAASFM